MSIQIYPHPEPPFYFSESQKGVKINGPLPRAEMKTAEKTNDNLGLLIGSIAIGILIGNVFSLSWSGSILTGIFLAAVVGSQKE